MASRLDKLFELLESNNQSIRLAAAVQIGKISTNNQVKLKTLLNKLIPFVKHKTWSVRIAAAEAVKWIGMSCNEMRGNDEGLVEEGEEKGNTIWLDRLDLVEILKIGTRLYSTDVREIDAETPGASSGEGNEGGVNHDEISRHLGLVIPDEMEMKAILTKEDFEMHQTRDNENKMSVEKAVEQSMGNNNDSLRNLKRECRKRAYNDCEEKTEIEGRVVKMERLEEDIKREEDKAPGGRMGHEWEWRSLCEELLVSVWHPRWEVRHGAATALRELARSQGRVLGGQSGSGRLLQHALGRLLCTLALDQLSDFVSDEMVAPVRESCAQALGLLAVSTSASLVSRVVDLLLSLLRPGTEWTATHGALLALKYLLAARPDQAAHLLPRILPAIQSRLSDPAGDDDVRCAAAAALSPLLSVTGANIDNIQSLMLLSLRHDLWTLLALRPDSSGIGSIGSVLNLLEKLYLHSIHLSVDQESGEQMSEKQLDTAVNHLHWYYFSYSDAVRLSAVRTCTAVLRFYERQLDRISPTCLCQIMSQLLQRVLIDENSNVVSETENLWLWIVDKISCEVLAQSCLERLDVWMCCAMQPSRLSYAHGVILLPQNDSSAEEDCKHQFPKEFFIGGRESFLSEGCSNVREEAVLQARLAACKLIANLCRKLSEIQPITEHILIAIIARIHLKERLAVQRFVAASILAYWNPNCDWVVTETNQMLAPLRQQLLTAIEEPIYYQELLPAFRQMVKSCRDLQACYIERGIDTPHRNISTNLNLSQCQQLVSDDLLACLGDEEIHLNKFSCAKTSVEVCARQHTDLSRLVEVSIGRAMLAWGWLPTLLTPLIKPLMDVTRSDERPSVQTEAACALSQLVVEHISNPRLTGSISKLVRNLIQYLSDSIDSISPSPSNGEIIALQKTTQLGRDALPHQEEFSSDLSAQLNPSLIKLKGSRLALEKICERLFSSTNQSDLSIVLQLVYNQPLDLLSNPNSRNTSIAQIVASLRSMETCVRFMNDTSLVNLSQFADCLFQYGLAHRDSSVRHWSARLIVLLASPPSLSVMINQSKDTNQCPSISNRMDLCRDIIDRLLLGRTVSVLESSLETESLSLGAIELLYLSLQIAPLSARLALVSGLLPVALRCLNGPLESVRRTATHAFSQLLSLLPLEQSGADVSILSPSRQQQRVSNIEFIQGLTKPDSIPADQSYEQFVTASLRSYQKHGVNWLSFLNRYGLHGVLADDMGLGKTLQTICAIVSEYVKHDSTNGSPPPPSLIVCPATVTGHWQQEVSRHICKTAASQFSCIVYSGSVDARQNLWLQLHRYQLVITSYDILRNDIDRLIRPPPPPLQTVPQERQEDSDSNTDPVAGAPAWSYLVLDEGHLIRNHKSKIAVAVKSVNARHRLLLTGTPIQNRVAELWSLFDFLMPGLLGSHSDFHKRFGRLLDHHNSRSRTDTDYHSSSSNSVTSSFAAGVGVGSSISLSSESGALALDQLHRQVLPFMLRRIKDDVLNELPPKIMQDYLCSMTPLQSRLYAACIESQRRSLGDLSLETDILDNVSIDNNNVNQRKHVFQAMHYLRLVCNHPALALCQSHPLLPTIKKEVAATNQSLDDIKLSGKLVALKQLILDCGIGTGTTDELSISGNSCDLIGSDGAAVVSNHRLLVFCQTRSMLALVEKMICSEIPKASHLRLDGSVPVKDRQQIVDRFNQDASIDLLLLTTSIGGLGLNLTSADIVIFVEHDWNPMRDLQAMDRAHRIGQQRTVNVYRLITSDSIEEKIMNLQKFKLFIANSVVTADNKQMGSMNTDCLLDIMNKEMVPPAASTQHTVPSSSGSSGSSGPSGGLRSVTARLDNVYDCLDEYNEEYNLNTFVQNL